MYMLTFFKHIYNLFRSQTRAVGLARRASGWAKVEKEFLSKNPVCAICGTNKKLNVHHKKPFHLHPELELDETNLITLCMGGKECHLLIGHGNLFRAYNPNIETDAQLLNKDISQFDSVAAKAKANRLLE